MTKAVYITTPVEQWFVRITKSMHRNAQNRVRKIDFLNNDLLVVAVLHHYKKHYLGNWGEDPFKELL